MIIIIIIFSTCTVITIFTILITNIDMIAATHAHTDIHSLARVCPFFQITFIFFFSFFFVRVPSFCLILIWVHDSAWLRGPALLISVEKNSWLFFKVLYIGFSKRIDRGTFFSMDFFFFFFLVYWGLRCQRLSCVTLLYEIKNLDKNKDRKKRWNVHNAF